MLPAFAACCKDLVERWKGLAAGEEPCEVDIWPETQNLTGDARHLQRRVRQQLPRGQEDLSAPGGADRAHHSGHGQAAHPWLPVSSLSLRSCHVFQFLVCACAAIFFLVCRAVVLMHSMLVQVPADENQPKDGGDRC
jgi:hypothetical protein